MGILKNVFIISARRSGTHLTTDAIVNNFGYERIDNSIDHDFLTNENVEEFIDKMKSGGKLAWSHFHDYENFFDRELDPKYIKEIKGIFHEAKIIYVYRDIRDVITSDYYRERNQLKFNSFKEYYNNNLRDYRTIVNYNGSDDDLFTIIAENHKNWFSVYFARELLGVDMEIISYEDTILKYDETINKIGNFLDLKCDDIKDVRLKTLEDKTPGIKYTHNEFRRGRIGDWKETFGEEWGEEIVVEYEEEILYHLTCYLEAPVLHKNHSPERKYFHTGSRNWGEIELETNIELKSFRDEFIDFTKSLDIEYLIRNRYRGERHSNVRYKHKVFYFNDLVLKFVYPCKHSLDLTTFKEVVPIGSKLNLLTILKTYKTLYELKITPKLHYAGIHDNILVIVQERLDETNLVSDMKEMIPMRWWEWMTNTKLFPQALELFSLGFNENILLKDMYSAQNFIFERGKLSFVDLDGILLFDDQESMKQSKEYSETMDFLTNNNKLWMERYGENPLEQYNF